MPATGLVVPASSLGLKGALQPSLICIGADPAAAGSLEWGAKEKSVVKVPQVAGLISGALGPPQTFRSISSTGTWGRSLKTAVSLPGGLVGLELCRGA